MKKLKRKQKIFFLGTLASAASIASIPMTVMQMSQGDAQAAAAETQNKQQIAAMNKQTAAINNLAAKNPAMGPQLGAIKSYSEHSVLEKERLFGVAGDVWSTVKNVYRSTPGFGNQLKMGLGMGGVLAAGKYIMGKSIDNDAKNNGIDLKAAAKQNKQQAQRAYSILDKRLFSIADMQHTMGSVSLGGQAMNAAFAVPEAMSTWKSWKEEKNALKGMKTQSDPIKSVMNKPTRNGESTKQFSSFTAIGRGAKKVYNFLGNFAGSGNSTQMATAGKKLVDTAGNNNIQKSVGNFMKDHKYITTGIGLVGGFKAVEVGQKMAEKVVEKPLRKMDSNAYNWQDYQDSKVQK